MEYHYLGRKGLKASELQPGSERPAEGAVRRCVPAEGQPLRSGEANAKN